MPSCLCLYSSHSFKYLFPHYLLKYCSYFEPWFNCHLFQEVISCFPLRFAILSSSPTWCVYSLTSCFQSCLAYLPDVPPTWLPEKLSFNPFFLDHPVISDSDHQGSVREQRDREETHYCARLLLFCCILPVPPPAPSSSWLSWKDTGVS